MIFAYIIHAYVDTRQRRTKDIFNIFQKGSVFGIDAYISFEHASSHKYAVLTAESLRMARSEMTGYAFLVLIEKSQTCFENTSCKLLAFNISANSSWA